MDHHRALLARTVQTFVELDVVLQRPRQAVPDCIAAAVLQVEAVGRGFRVGQQHRNLARVPAVDRFRVFAEHLGSFEASQDAANVRLELVCHEDGFAVEFVHEVSQRVELDVVEEVLLLLPELVRPVDHAVRQLLQLRSDGRAVVDCELFLLGQLQHVGALELAIFLQCRFVELQVDRVVHARRQVGVVLLAQREHDVGDALLDHADEVLLDVIPVAVVVLLAPAVTEGRDVLPQALAEVDQEQLRPQVGHAVGGWRARQQQHVLHAAGHETQRTKAVGVVLLHF